MQVTTKDWIHLTKPETTGIDPYDLESREKLKDPKERRTNEFAGILRHQFFSVTFYYFRVSTNHYVLSTPSLLYKHIFYLLFTINK